MKKSIAALLIAAIVPVLSFAQADLQPAAIVKLARTEPITVKQLKAEVQKYEARAGRTLSVAERKQVLDVMINERLAMQAAERDKVLVSEAEINSRIQTLRQQLADQIKHLPTDEELSSAIKAQTGLDLADYKADLKKQMTIQNYLFTVKKDFCTSVRPVTPAEVQLRYDLEKAKLVRPDTIRFVMLFVPKGQNDAEQQKNRALAESMTKDLAANPKKFDEYVVRAQAPGAAYQAGDGGFLPKTPEAMKIVGSEFMSVAFALKLGDVSRLMENAKGFQIIKITESYLQKTLDLDDPYQLGQKASVREYLTSLMNQERQQKAVDTATTELLQELRSGNTYQVFDKNLSW